MKKLTKSKEFGILCVLIILILFFSFRVSQFAKINNILNIARQIASLGIVAVGFTMVLITGGIDLSVGYQISVANVVCAFLMVEMGVNPVLAAIIVIIIGTAIGFMNGIIITKTGVAPIIVTLSVMNILNGISFMISKGLPIFGFPKSFSILGQGAIKLPFAGVEIPISLIILIIIVILGAFILQKTYFGRYFYAIGSNEEAAELSGVKTGKIRILAYSLCGFFTSIAGIVTLSRINSGQPVTGAGFEFVVLTACVIGGVSSSGGKGTMMGAFIGVLIMGVLDNGLLLMNVGAYVQLVIKGIVLLVAVTYDVMSRKNSEKIKKIKAINVENVIKQ